MKQSICHLSNSRQYIVANSLLDVSAALWCRILAGQLSIILCQKIKPPFLTNLWFHYPLVIWENYAQNVLKTGICIFPFENCQVSKSFFLLRSSTVEQLGKRNQTVTLPNILKQNSAGICSNVLFSSLTFYFFLGLLIRYCKLDYINPFVLHWMRSFKFVLGQFEKHSYDTLSCLIVIKCE